MPKAQFKGKKRKSSLAAGGNNTHLSICGGNKLSGLAPTATASASVHVAYNVGNPQRHALVNLFPTCCELQKQSLLNPKPNACPKCLSQYLKNPRCKNKKYKFSRLEDIGSDDFKWPPFEDMTLSWFFSRCSDTLKYAKLLASPPNPWDGKANSIIDLFLQKISAYSDKDCGCSRQLFGSPLHISDSPPESAIAWQCTKDEVDNEISLCDSFCTCVTRDKNDPSGLGANLICDSALRLAFEKFRTTPDIFTMLGVFSAFFTHQLCQERVCGPRTSQNAAYTVFAKEVNPSLIKFLATWKKHRIGLETFGGVPLTSKFIANLDPVYIILKTTVATAQKKLELTQENAACNKDSPEENWTKLRDYYKQKYADNTQYDTDKNETDSFKNNSFLMNTMIIMTQMMLSVLTTDIAANKIGNLMHLGT